MLNFNFWTIFAPLGAAVATYIGYLTHGMRYANLARKTVAVVMAIVLGLLLLLESYRGGTQLMLDTIANDEFEVAVLCMVAGFMTVAGFYGWTIHKLIMWGGELRYPAAVRKARRQKQDYTITKVISVRDIARALRQAETQEPEKG